MYRAVGLTVVRWRMRAACPSCSTQVDTDPGELAACSACGHWWIADEPAEDAGAAPEGTGSGSSLSGPLDEAGSSSSSGSTPDVSDESDFDFDAVVDDSMSDDSLSDDPLSDDSLSDDDLLPPIIPDGDPAWQLELGSDSVPELGHGDALSDGPSLHPSDGAAPLDAAPSAGAPSVAPDSVAPDSVAPDSVAPDSVARDSVAPDSVARDSDARDSDAAGGDSAARASGPDDLSTEGQAALPASLVGADMSPAPAPMLDDAPPPVPRPVVSEIANDLPSSLPVPQMVPPDQPWEFELQLAVGDRVQGPFDRMLLQEELYTGLLTGDERIRVPGSTVWGRLGDREEFAKVLHLLGKDEDVRGQRRIASWQRSSAAATASGPAAAGTSPAHDASASPGPGLGSAGSGAAPGTTGSLPSTNGGASPSPDRHAMVAPVPASTGGGGGKMALVAGVVVVVVALVALAAYFAGT
jgi:hypothetical protein